MKSLVLFTLLLSFVATEAFAQWQTGTQTTSMGRWAYYKPGSQYENLGFGVRTNLGGGWAWQLVDGSDVSYFHVDYPSGNLGLGTNSPAGRFHLVDNNVSIYSSTGVSNSWSKDGLTVLANPDAGYSTLKILSQHSPVSDRGVLTVVRGTTSLFYVRTDGNLGVGTEAPEAKLHVNGDIRIPSTSKMVFGTDAGGFGEYIKNFSNGLGLFTNSTQRVTVDNSGNFGIGIATPSQKLNVYNGNMSLKVSSNSNEQSILFENSGGAYTWKIGRVDAGSNYADLIFSSGKTSDINALVNQVAFKTNGDVGIGTTSPDSKLTVKGVIHAEEVKVDLNVPGPDYVFESDYPLTTLEATKAYIEQNKHLPGIPSSDEMQQNGVNLLEMNMKLLEKVEEITLHLIELKEENYLLRERITTLEKSNRP